MCGIVGVAGDLAVKHERVFTDLLVMNQLRGFDSIGVAKIGYARKPTVLKTLEHPASLIQSKEYKDLLSGSNRVLLGHNRAATVGDVNVLNAHPFTHGAITGVHNGTVAYRKDLEDHQNFQVDSDNIYYHINKKGVKDLWPKLWGAASLVWWNEDEESLNFLRNKERPMYLAFDKERKVIIWASEFYMLYAATFRNGVQLASAPIATTVDFLYSFNMGKGWKKGNVMECTEERIPYYAPRQPAYVYKPQASYTPPDNSPAWLRIGNTIDICFDARTEVNNWIQFSGWSPLDDRVNITVNYVKAEGVEPIVNLADKLQIYRGQVSAITRIWRSGALEFDVKVVGVHKAINSKGDKISLEEYEDEKVGKHLDEIKSMMDGDVKKGEDGAPFEEADMDCSVLCTFKNKKLCKKCRQAFGIRAGNWSAKKEKNYFCDWCGSVHGDGEIVYITDGHDESYCADCFKQVVDYLFQRNITQWN